MTLHEQVGPDQENENQDNQHDQQTNHDNGDKKVAFLLEGFDSVEIQGNGSELIFHGQIFPFQFENITTGSTMHRLLLAF